MLMCDRCVINQANHVLKLVGAADLKYGSWTLCDGCFNHMCGETRKIVEGYCPPGLLEFCPSLTPEQAKQVEKYVASRSKVKPEI